MMRAIVLGLLVSALPQLGLAACKELPLGETEGSFIGAVMTRMAATGVGDFFPTKTDANGFRMYVLIGSDVRVIVRCDGGLLQEVRTLIGEPTTAETDRLFTAAAFSIARFSDVTEADAKSELYAMLDATNRDGKKMAGKLLGGLFVDVQRPGDGTAIIAQIGKCASD